MHGAFVEINPTCTISALSVTFGGISLGRVDGISLGRVDGSLRGPYGAGEKDNIVS